MPPNSLKTPLKRAHWPAVDPRGLHRPHTCPCWSATAWWSRHSSPRGRCSWAGCWSRTSTSSTWREALSGGRGSSLVWDRGGRGGELWGTSCHSLESSLCTQHCTFFSQFISSCMFPVELSHYNPLHLSENVQFSQVLLNCFIERWEKL